MNRIATYIFGLLLLLGTFSSDASHVVGGELYYNQLSAGRYEIVFKIYFDCANANPGVIDRDGGSANIGFFDAVTFASRRQLTFTNAVNTEVNSVNYECVKEPSGICVIQYVYKQVVNIDPGANGLIVAHQLCCRNGITKNVFNAGETGSTYWSYIPPSTVTNSSPRFSEIPPTYVCLDAPLELDYSATDPDGDSLVYEFYTPYVGGSADVPKPNTPSPPIYSELVWNTGYTANNQIPGSPSGYVDPKTGKYTITPTEKGTYTIGVKVSEYRNGVLIGATLSDYQYTVIDCEFDVLADFDIPNGTTVDGTYSFECGDTATFRNRSILKPGLKGKFIWDFGDPTTNEDTVTTFSLGTPVSYDYPGNGDYTVTLRVVSSICEDEYEYNIRIRSTRGFSLGPDRIFCDSVRYFLDTKAADAVSVTWNTGQTTSFILATDTGTYIADVSYGKCAYKDTVVLTYNNVPPIILPEDTLICDSIFSITLDAGQPDLLYEWETPSRLNTRSIQVSDTGIYTLKMSNATCSKYDTIRVWQSTPPRIRDSLFCNEVSYSIDVGDIEEAEFLWSDGSVGRFKNFTEIGTYWVKVTQRECESYDTFSIANSIIRLDLGKQEHFCDVVLKELDAGEDGAEYLWNTLDLTRTVTVRDSGLYSVRVTNKEGCVLEDSIQLTLSQSPDISLANDTSICVNTPITIGVTEGLKSYEWSNGEITNAITTILEGKYKVLVTDNFNCQDSDSIYITVDSSALPNILYIPNAFTPNSDTHNDWFPYSDEVIQPAFSVKVYTRWGEKVFDSQEVATTRWDGFYKGDKVTQGTYIYLVSYRGCDGDVRTDRGTLQILY
ncbi:MAG: T9SS type B sorting domain-containing protein [Bacteroidetes bacterium]|nr:T9SS type B sorting domain-containing protein [Bacteroidota bacterium]